MSVRMSESGTECLQCGRDKHSPKSYSCKNDMDPGSVPLELVVSEFHSDLGLTEVEEMLISAVILIMSVYRLPQGQYGYIQWACCQPPPGCGLLCSESAPTSF